MTSPEPYEIRLGKVAARAFERLPQELRQWIRKALLDLARRVSEGGRIGGKRSKSIRGSADTFHRLYENLDRHDALREMTIRYRELMHSNDGVRKSSELPLDSSSKRSEEERGQNGLHRAADA